MDDQNGAITIASMARVEKVFVRKRTDRGEQTPSQHLLQGVMS